MGFLSGLFGGGDYTNPADAAKPYLDQIPGVLQQYYSPYVDSGKRALGTLEGQYNDLISDPNSKFSQFASQFSQSPGYQFQYNQGMNAANNAAASGGMLGTPYHQQNASSMASNLANQDFYNYMKNILGMYGQGLGGMEGINQLGFQGAQGLAGGLSSNLMNQGGLAFQGQANQNQMSADKSGAMGNLIGMVGGGLLGGPAGAAMGSQAGGMLSKFF